jgi:BirA family transcriptional regulator, biotin operon repressor / biotin---[acetyl-CoA-carboxylase] ligase
MDNVLHLTSTGSTNEDAYQLALDGAPHGYTVIADEQTSGKGRLGRSWVAPTDTCLCCSLILRPKIPFVEFPRLTLTSGLALCKVIAKLTGLNIFGLKWPNDLYCEGKKCGGILVESSSPVTTDEKSFVVVGVGLNVNSLLDEFPGELQETVTSLLIQTAKHYSIPELFIQLRHSLLHHLKIHEELGFGAILKEWLKYDVLYGKEMQWLTTEKKVITGIGLGPDDSGQLLVKDRMGNHHLILSGDVSLKD